MNKKIVPIVFAINDNYVPYCGVAIKSLMENSSEEYIYKIHVFYSTLSDYNIYRMESMSTDNIHIKCVDVSQAIPDVELKNKNHVSKETVYRIIAPIVLNEYDKILYLDSDMIILDDVAKLYNIDMGDCILGAVVDKITNQFLPYLTDRNIEPNGYFNSGVLLLNTQKMIENNILGKVVEILNNDTVYNFPDQDSLNLVCSYKDVYYLDDGWNLAWHSVHSINRIVDWQVEKVIKSKENPHIIHFTTHIKAWQNPELEFANYFWKYARMTAFYEEIIFKNMPKLNIAPNPYARFIFPWKTIKADSRIVMYGAGVVGRAFLQQIEQTKYCTIMAVADKKKDEIKDLNIPVILPIEIKDFPYDNILIAIESAGVADAIKHDLIELGYDESKIVWLSPAK